MAYLKVFLFFIVMALYLWFPYSLITGYEQVLDEGTVFRFKPQPVDPYDAFRGQYIRLSYENPPKQSTQVYQDGQPIFVQVQKDSTGYAYFGDLKIERPRSDNYIKTTIRYARNERVYFQLPENMKRFYMNERLAPLAEQAYRQLTSEPGNTLSTYVDVRVHEGQVVIEELYFEGLPAIVYLQKLIEQGY